MAAKGIVMSASIHGDLFDRAADAAIKARISRRMDKAQCGNLLEVANSFSISFGKNLDSVKRSLIVFIGRQTSRGEIPRDAARSLIDGIIKAQKLDELTSYLGLFKWMFEALEGRPSPAPKESYSFDDFKRVVSS